MKRSTISLALLLGFVGAGLAVEPPDLVNFQGVLRKDNGKPVIDGPHDVEFRFLDADVAGNLLLTDVRTGPNAVMTQKGLFNVALGEPTTVTPGVYSCPPPSPQTAQ